MGWTRADDDTQYAVARQLQRAYGGRWLVFWGPGSRAYWAFYRGPEHVRPLSAAQPEQLHQSVLDLQRQLDLATGRVPFKQ